MKFMDRISRAEFETKFFILNILNNIKFLDRAFKGYEEVRVPAVKASTPAEGEKLVRIDALEEWARPAFAGYKCVNYFILLFLLLYFISYMHFTRCISEIPKCPQNS